GRDRGRGRDRDRARISKYLELESRNPDLESRVANSTANSSATANSIATANSSVTSISTGDLRDSQRSHTRTAARGTKLKKLRVSLWQTHRNPAKTLDPLKEVLDEKSLAIQ